MRYCAFLLAMCFARPLSGVVVAQRLDIPGRQCDLQAVQRLPDLAAVLDSAAAAIALAPFRDSPGQVLISLTYTPAGGAGRARVFVTDLPDSVARAVLQVVAENVRDLGGGDLPGTRILITVDTQPRFRLEPALYCPPEPSGGPTGRVLVDVTTASAPGPGRLRSPPMRALVGEDGRVQLAELEGTSGLATFDQALLQRLRETTFKPALLDGAPLAIWIRRP